MQWFSGLKTVEEVKAHYRKLAMQHHPDRGGDTATMQEINAQYHTALKGMDRQQSKGADNETHTYYYNEYVEQSVMDKLAELLRIKADMTIMLIGRWLWVEFDKKPSREILDQVKAIKFMWHSKRSMWYWHPPTGQKTKYSGLPMENLAAAYGYKEYRGKAQSDEMVAA
jgi:hypothetical protein